MSTNVVLYESKQGIAIITLNRPEKLNAMNGDMWGALEATWRRFTNSDDRVAILTAAGERAFCVGADLNDPTLEVWRAIPGHIVEVDKPVIAAVFGHCLGGGMGLVQFADICVAADDTQFAFPEARVGLAIGGASSLVARVPHKIAMELMLTGESISAQRAYEVGLVNKVVARERLMEAAMDYAERIAANAPLVLGMLKRYAREVTPRGPVENAALWRREPERIFASRDAKEGIAAFREGRKPKFVGI
ncbi:MAG TPA: enoyl-CoA hydratase/isomerase family protein [Vicinamibacteria bacterium]|nr:enoyl-CoA hydratase/isomerase family protein [Vicinamibacteria bacterium]